jgi:hypothetical protein
MRKLWIVALALAAVIAVAGVAVAANTYQVFLAKASTGKGTRARPIPTKFDFGYRVGDTENLRPFPVKEYRIAAEGLFAFPKSRPRCTFAAASDPLVTDPADISSACRRAKIGGGTLDNFLGAGTDRSQKAPCKTKLTLFNISTGDPQFPKTVTQIRRRGGLAIRIDADPPECPAPDHEALAAPFYDIKLDGIPTTDLRFTVPDRLAHPSGLDLAVVETTSHVQKLTGLVTVRNGVPVAAAKRRVGFYSLVGRKGKTRTLRVTFIDESGAKFTATKKFR